MKKLYAVLILAIFLVSLMPVALAKQGPNQDQPEKQQVNEEAGKAKALGRAEGETVLERQRVRVQNLVKACVSKGATEDRCKGLFEKRLTALKNLPQQAIEKINQFKNKRIEKFNELKNDKYLSKFDKLKGFKARKVAKEKLQNVRQNFEKAKKKFGLAKEKFAQTKNNFEKAKSLQICKDEPESENCTLAREELTQLAKDKLTDQIDILLENLDQIKAKAEENEALTEEELQDVLTFIEDKESELEDIRLEIEAATTKAEIVEAAKNLKNAWNKQRVQAHVGYMINARMGGIIVSADHLEAKLERVLERMIENGKDTSSVEPLVSDFDEQISLAKEKFEASQDLFAEAKNLEAQERATKVQEAQALLKESKDALKQGNIILKDIVQELRNSNALEELSNANESEDIETELEQEEAQ